LITALKIRFILWLLKIGKFLLLISKKLSTKDQTMPNKNNAMTTPMTTPLTHYQYRKIEGALAIVRYTTYNDSNQVFSVDQVTYQPGEMTRLEEEMTAALDCGIECLVITDQAIDDFSLFTGRLRPMPGTPE
tara:strand:- start:481 stop:876 length:396 start_codon:yes stop_codon:yes gene_type:complete